jgi:hypothetical protein
VYTQGECAYGGSSITAAAYGSVATVTFIAADAGSAVAYSARGLFGPPADNTRYTSIAGSGDLA